MMHTNIRVKLKLNFMSSLSDIHLFNHFKILNLFYISSKIFAFDALGIQCCLHPFMPYINAVQDDISAQTIPI